MSLELFTRILLLAQSLRPGTFMAQKLSIPSAETEAPPSNVGRIATMEPKVLLIEDSAEDIALIERAFRRVLPTVTLKVINNGEEAIAYLLGEGAFSDRRRYPMPDLILLDLQIPRKSGLEVLAWIWEQAHLKPIRVVVLTGSQNSAHLQRVHELDAYYQLKPAKFEQLAEFIET